MKIKTKFLLGLSSKPILILLLIWIGWFQLSSLNKLSDTTKYNYNLSLLAENIQREVKDEAISLRNVVIFNNQELIQKELDHLQLKSDSIIQNIALLESTVKTAEQRKMVENLKSTNQKFTIYVGKVKELISEGKKDEAIQLISENGHPIQIEFFQVIKEITDHMESNMGTSFDKTTTDLKQKIIITSIISLISIIISASFIAQTVWTFATRLSKVSGVMTKVANGAADLSTRVEVKSNDEIDDVAISFNRMSASLEEQRALEKGVAWSKSNIADITTSLSGLHNLEILSRTFLSKVVPLMESCHAVFYVKELDEQKNQPVYKLHASYGFNDIKHLSNSFVMGDGLVGQAAFENAPIILTDVPSDYIRVKSGLGDALPLVINVLPVSYEGDVKAVLEIASFKPFNSTQQAFLEELVKGLGIILESVMGRIRLAKLLEETQVLMEEIQAQSEELQAQQEELRVTNEELEEQAQMLRQSEEKLQVQQEELEQTNIELIEKADTLEEQNKILALTNREVERARADLEEKARQLTLSSKYKSEFLANMSHELRTPLNSLLILSKLLSDNQDGNLSDKQVEYSKTIYSSGKDLLMLINDILDLAKIESGKIDVYPSKVQIKELVNLLEERFKPIALEKNLEFHIVLKEGLPDFINSDEKRILQVLENLLSNAFKFTYQGAVTLQIDLSSKRKEQSILSFSIIDSGVGIPRDKQDLIFEAFQQADGTTSRKYGGTGLGLSICRQISELLGGEIFVESEENQGSIFTFKVGDYQEEEHGREVILHLDEVAVTKEKTIDNKQEVEVIKSIPFESKKPNDYIKRLLIVDDDMKQRISLMELLSGKNVILKAVSTGMEAMEELKVNPFDFMVLDLGLTDTTGFDLLEKMKISGFNENLNIIIYTARDVSSKEEIYLKQYASAIIIKNELAPQRLMDELKLYLDDNDDKAESIKPADSKEIKILSGLAGRKILLVDDDVRNVFALSSFLEIYGMNILFAENGLECLEVMEKNSDIDLVLMDIMMPEMDGYEAIRRLRANPEFMKLPVIALTAKAMKEDREKCIEAGASDYIVKPYDPEQLISLMCVWLYPQEGKK